MQGSAIQISGLTKNFGGVRAVDTLSFSVEPGVVTGFLGPNGAGKTTTLRMLLGLVEADAGTATIGGHKYVDIERPASTVGAALEAASFHPGRTALDHLRVHAPLVGVSDKTCGEVLDHVGLGAAADRKVGGFSLGMRQRLGLATTLLGDPGVLVLDEPANGLDPEGIVWLRGFLRHLAHDEGRTVLVSSHVLGEVQATVDNVVVIAGGRLVHESPLEELVAMAASKVKVVTPDADGFVRLAQERGWEFETVSGGLTVMGASPAEVGAAAHAEHLEIHGLAGEGMGLEEVFLRLTDPRRGEEAA
ncbi:ABC transporter ATP-binding protein [Nocardioides sp. Soil797]|nr:ABC transporter ATP-binding protein [Nocardioides sp. Soil797]